jgi:general secretion pathway protein G
MFKFRAGFTLIEMVVVLVMIGVLAVIVAPKFARARTDTQVTATAEDLHSIIEAIELFRANKGYWPIDTKAGVIPPEIKKNFGSDNPFIEPSPIGGIYEYENLKTNNTINILIGPSRSAPAPSIVDAQALDEYIDDGVLNRGKFRSTSNGGYVYRFTNR